MLLVTGNAVEGVLIEDREVEITSMLLCTLLMDRIVGFIYLFCEGAEIQQKLVWVEILPFCG